MKKRWLIPLLILGGLAQPLPAQAGEVFRSALERPVRLLDPIYFTTPEEHQVGLLLYNRLVTYRPVPGYGGPGPLHEVVPDLAESWDLSSDQRSYVFRLRKNARFHNGRLVHAVDVKYSLERVADPKNHSPGYWAYEKLGIEQIRLLDNDMIEVRLRRPHPYALDLLTLPYFSIVPQEEVERRFADPPPYILDLRQLPFASVMVEEQANMQWQGFGRHPIGTGPYVLKDWQPQQGTISLAQFPQYHQPSVPAIPEISFSVIPQIEERFLHFTEKKLEHASLPLDFFRRVLADPVWNPLGEEKLVKAEAYQDLSRSRIVKAPQWQMHSLVLNNQAFPFNQIKVRQAFNFALDKQYMTDVLLQSYGQAMHGLLPPGFPGSPGRERPPFPHNLDQARKLLFEAGWKDTDLDGDLEPVGQPELQLVLWYDQSPLSFMLCQAAQADLAKAGVMVKLQSLRDWTSTLAPDFFHAAWTPEFADPAAILTLQFHSAEIARDNLAQYSNSRVDRLLEEADRILIPEHRYRLYQEAESILLEEAPWLFLIHPVSYRIVQPHVTRYSEHPLLPFPYQFYQLHSR